MIVSWLIYAVFVTVLLGLAAYAAERALRLAGRPARLVWLGTMSFSVLIPGATFAIRTWMPETALGLPSVGFSELVLPALWTAGDTAVSAWTTQRVTELALSAAWVVASLALLGLLVHSQWRLRRERAGWLRARVDGVPVLVSRRTGPATVGSLRPRVVFPEWALALPSARREMILRHELEHVRARDGLVALVGFGLAALAPWNPTLWWMLARLRLAQEMDCDRRLLTSGVPVRGYVDLLMTTGQPALHAALAAPGLSFSQSTLRKRILQMTHIPRPSSLVQATAIGAVAIGLGLLACDTPAPGDTDSLTGPTASAVATEEAVEDLHFGPRDVAGHVMEKIEWNEESTTLDLPFGTWAERGVTLDLLVEDELDKLRDLSPMDREARIRQLHLRVEDDLRKAKESTDDHDVGTFGAARDHTFRLRKLEMAPDAGAEFFKRMDLDRISEDAPSLLVLDGMIWEGSREELKFRLSENRPTQVEVLAGPEAEARFGARAASGAILLETDGN